MLGLGRKGREPRNQRPAQGAAALAEAVSGFPRGLPDGDPYRAAATARGPRPKRSRQA